MSAERWDPARLILIRLDGTVSLPYAPGVAELERAFASAGIKCELRIVPFLSESEPANEFLVPA